METCKQLLLLLFITSSISVMAQRKPVLLNHIAITVKNLEKSASFYRNLLQLDTIPEPFKDGKHAWFRVGEHSQLHVIEAKGNYTTFKGNHICFTIASMDNFIAALQKAKIPFESWEGKPGGITVRPDGVKQIYLQDPDGYWLEINDDRF